VEDPTISVGFREGELGNLIGLQTSDGHILSAWSSTPADECKGGVIVLHAVFGLTNHIGNVCDKWAAAGFRALAPALFDRLGKDIVYPYGRAGAESGLNTYEKLSSDQILADVQACRLALLPYGPVAISGFCTGGSWAWTSAAHIPFAAQVNFYGSHVHERLGEAPLCPTQLHYGSSDHVVGQNEQGRIAERYPEVKIHCYEGAGHAFMNPEQEFFDAEAEALAWARSVAFVEQTFVQTDASSLL
jgi:carboxymethylenebutenolidase